MVEAKHCFHTTQAFYLTNLFRLIINDENYKKYSRETLEKDVLSHAKSGQAILELSAEFEEEMKNASTPEEMPMCYVEKILQIQYPDKDSLDRILNSIWINSESMFGVTLFYTESMKRAKYIDSQALSE